MTEFLEFKSKFIKETDILIRKPSYLSLLANPAIKMEINNIDLPQNISLFPKEFFLNEDKTFLTYPIEIKLGDERQKFFLENIYYYFYNVSSNDDVKKIEKIIIKNKNIYLEIFKNNFEIIPEESKIIFNFLIENSTLKEKLEIIYKK